MQVQNKILILDEFCSVAELKKRKTLQAKDHVDYECLMVHRVRFEKHLLRGFLHLGLGDFVFRHSLQLSGVDLRAYPLIILNQTNRDPEVFIKYIRRHNSKCRLLYQYWNTVISGTEKAGFKRFLENRKRYRFDVVSFDKGDCRKWGFVYGPQYIPGGIERSQYQGGPEVDVFFVGKDKNRLDFLKKIEQELEKRQISSKIWVLPDNRKKVYQLGEKKYLMAHEVPHQEVIRQDQKSRAILDVVQNKQAGLTWRAIEALLLQKKLITTFEDIKDYDFYRKENIFIWGKDDLAGLKTFIDSPYQPVEKEIMEQYTFEGWLKTLYRTMHWDVRELERKS